MKIVRAQHAGMCFGVRDALAEAKRLAADGPLTILGELVHNPVAREQLRARGVKEDSLDSNSVESRRVMITAHGTSDAKRRKWKEAGYEVFDGTCPLVRHAHEQLKLLVAAGYFPLVIGQPGHVEVRGLTEDFSQALVITGEADILQIPEQARYGVIAQTTQPIARVHGLVAEIRNQHPEAEVVFVDTVCRPTKDRQVALQELIEQADTIVVVGGHHSNNTRQLVLTCRAAGKRAIHVERPEELDPADFTGVEVVGLTAGTSTLPETIEAVFERLLGFSSNHHSA